MQEINSLTPTLQNPKKYNDRKVSVPEVIAMTIGINNAFIKTGESRDKIGICLIVQTFLSLFVKIAATSVADVPMTISKRPKGLAILDMKQPIARPGIAAGVNMGNTAKASEKRN